MHFDYVRWWFELTSRRKNSWNTQYLSAAYKWSTLMPYPCPTVWKWRGHEVCLLRMCAKVHAWAEISRIDLLTQHLRNRNLHFSMSNIRFGIFLDSFWRIALRSFLLRLRKYETDQLWIYNAKWLRSHFDKQTVLWVLRSGGEVPRHLLFVLEYCSAGHDGVWGPGAGGG